MQKVRNHGQALVLHCLVLLLITHINLRGCGSTRQILNQLRADSTFFS